MLGGASGGPAMRVRISGINTIRKRLSDGSLRVYRYHRATGIKLDGEPGSAEFIAAYAAAEKTMMDRHAGTFNGLIRDYSLSVEFGQLAESTKREYRRLLTKAEAKFGDLPIAALEDPRVRAEFLSWREVVARVSGAREADHRLSAVSAMLSWARSRGTLFSNHVSGFRRLYHVDRSEKIWLPEHVSAFMAVAPIELQRALILALHSGQRQGDLLRLCWSNYDGAAITLRQGKTGRRVDIPCTAALRRVLDGLDRKAAVILTTPTGRPWTARHFKAQWAKAATAAGITDLHFHDLRGTAVTMLAEAGCTPPQIAAITGHTLASASTIIDKYLARTRVLAGEAILLFENAKATKFANRLQTRPPKPKKGTAK